MISTAGLTEALSGVEGYLSIGEAELLYELAAQATSGCIVEVGTYRGRSTVALSLGASAGGDSPVFAVDPHERFTGVLGGEFGPEDRAAFFRNMIKSGCYANVRLVNLGSQTITPGWKLPVALLWIDGDHRYDGVRSDYSTWLPHLTRDARIAFDDATDPRLGPYRLIRELVATGPWCVVRRVGKIIVVQRRL